LFDSAELFDYFEEFWMKIVSDVLLTFWVCAFQWSLQCFEGILKENGAIIESAFCRSCNPQFKPFNLNLFPIKKFDFLTETFWTAGRLLADLEDGTSF
jgi:hypothetical protein